MGQRLYQLRQELISWSVLIVLALVSVVRVELTRPHHFSERSNLTQESFFPNSRPVKKPFISVPEVFLAWRLRFCNLNSKSDTLGLVRGIFLGDDSQVPDHVRAVFLDAGLAHLLAASGYNCWIVAQLFGLIALGALHLFGFRLRSLWYLRMRHLTLPLSRISGAWLFWLWSDQCAPITRSVVIISTKLVFDLLDLRASFVRLLFAQYLCSLIAMPTLFYSASFELTFGCLFGILLLPKALERFRPTRFPRFIWQYLTTSLGAVLGAMPTTWIVFNEINFMSIATNWFAVPPVSFLLMPLSLVQMMLLMPGIHELQICNWLNLNLAHLLGWVAQILFCGLRTWLAVFPSLRF